MEHFQDYLHHGFYPFFLEKRNFSENLLKTMNMMIEVDILLLKQIELKYLSKIKKLLYLLAVEGPVAPNVSQLATDIQTSRATVMNYIKYLADARLINMVYANGDEFPKKPARVMMHNTCLMYSIYPVKVEEQHVLETFFELISACLGKLDNCVLREVLTAYAVVARPLVLHSAFSKVNGSKRKLAEPAVDTAVCVDVTYCLARTHMLA